MNLGNCSVTLHPQEPIEPGNWAVISDEGTFVEVYLQECTIRVPVPPETDRADAANRFGLPL